MNTNGDRRHLSVRQTGLVRPSLPQRWSTQEVFDDDDDDDCNDSAADVYHDLVKAGSSQGAHVEDDGGGSTHLYDCVEVQHKILLWMTKLILFVMIFLIVARLGSFYGE